MHVNAEAHRGEVTKGRNIKKIVAWGCGAILILGGMLAALFAAAVVFTVKDTVDTVDEVRSFAYGFVGEMKSGDYEKLHGHLGEEVRGELSPADLKATFGPIRPIIALVPPTPFVVVKSDSNTWDAVTTMGSPIAQVAQTLHLVIERDRTNSERRYRVVDFTTGLIVRDLAVFPHSERALAFHQTLLDGELTDARRMTGASFEVASGMSLEEQVAAYRSIRNKEVKVVSFRPIDERRVDVTLMIEDNPEAPAVTYRVDGNDNILLIDGPRSMEIAEIDPVGDTYDTVFRELIDDYRASAQ